MSNDFWRALGATEKNPTDTQNCDQGAAEANVASPNEAA